MDRVTRHRFSVPDGLPVVGLFGGALVLAVLALIGLEDSRPGQIVTVVAALDVLASGAVLVRRLRRTAARLERRTREAEEAGARLKLLVEHVPAAVYIDRADPDVSDGGRLAYMSPQVAGILGYAPEDPAPRCPRGSGGPWATPPRPSSRTPSFGRAASTPTTARPRSPPTRSTGGAASRSVPSTGCSPGTAPRSGSATRPTRWPTTPRAAGASRRASWPT